MKVLVPIKRVVDPYVKVRVKQDGSDVESDNVKMTINPFCEIAVEAAIQLKEAGVVDEIIVVSIGHETCQEQLRSALALGADRAILVALPVEETMLQLAPLTVARTLTALCLQEEIELVILGKQSIDGDHNQVPQMLAGLLDWPQATYASQITISGDTVTVTVVREVESGLETVQIGLPAVISTDLRLNQPRYASLPNIMKAKTKPLAVLSLQDLNVEVYNQQQVIAMQAAPTRQRGLLCESVDELVSKIKTAL